MSKKTILIAAGGTGGHIFPALSVAKQLMPIYEIIWVGAKSGIENNIVPQNNIALKTLNISGLRKKGIFKFILMPFLLLYSFTQAFFVIFSTRPDVIVGFGGYVTFPICFMGWVLRVPVVIHEQNSVAGLTNKLLAKIANHVMVAFDGVLNSKKTSLVGNPVRADILNLAPIHERYSKRCGGLNILVVGGSLGARVFNEIMPQVCSELTNLANITHQVGNSVDKELIIKEYQKYNISANVVNFIDDMAYVYNNADLIVCRSGASTVSEIMAAGIAAIFIPYPYAVDDHQRYNAQPLVDINAGYMIVQSDLTVAKLSGLINSLDRERCMNMALNAHSIAITDSVSRIVNIIVKHII